MINELLRMMMGGGGAERSPAAPAKASRPARKKRGGGSTGTVINHGASKAVAGTRNTSIDRLQENVQNLAAAGLPGALIGQILNDAEKRNATPLSQFQDKDRIAALISADLRRINGAPRMRGGQGSLRSGSTAGGNLGGPRIGIKEPDTRIRDRAVSRKEARDDLLFQHNLEQKREEERLSRIMSLLGGLPKKKSGYSEEIVDIAGAKVPRKKRFSEDIDYTNQLLSLLR